MDENSFASHPPPSPPSHHPFPFLICPYSPRPAPDHQETIHWSQWFSEDEEQTYCWRISINSWRKGKPPRFSSSSKFCKGIHGLYTEYSQQSHTEDLSIWGSKLIKHHLENFLIYSYFLMVYVNNSYSLGDEWNTNSLGFSDEVQIWRKIIKLCIVNKIVINSSDKLRCYLKNLNFKLSGTGKPLYQQSWLVWARSLWSSSTGRYRFWTRKWQKCIHWATQ